MSDYNFVQTWMLFYNGTQCFAFKFNILQKGNSIL